MSLPIKDDALPDSVPANEFARRLYSVISKNFHSYSSALPLYISLPVAGKYRTRASNLSLASSASGPAPADYRPTGNWPSLPCRSRTGTHTTPHFWCLSMPGPFRGQHYCGYLQALLKEADGESSGLPAPPKRLHAQRPDTYKIHTPAYSVCNSLRIQYN